MDELEQIRMRKMQQMQLDAMNNQFQQESIAQQQLGQVEAFVKHNMTRDAISRYSNIKAVDPEKALQALMVMARALESRQVPTINDDLLKHFLVALTPQAKNIKIKRM